MSHSTYFFLLGRTPELSLAELRAVTGQTKLPEITPQIYAAEFESDEVARRIFSLLGGSLKLMKHEGEFADVSQPKLIEYITAYLAQDNRPTFAVAEFSRTNKERLSLIEIKKSLKARNIASRFIDGPREGLSAAVLLHHQVVEINIIELADKVILAKTLAVQDIDDWTVRDREKPYADRKKGMLPPKVARMMVNMAVGTQAGKSLVYDPFCGSGTVLMEAAMRGCDVAGSDLDKAAVAGAQANVSWLKEQYGLNFSAHIFMADVSAAPRENFPSPVNHIVTEPFLGRQTPSLPQLANIFKGLQKLYLGAFKHWTKILADEAHVVIIFPYVKTEKHAFSLESMIDKLQALGYTSTSGPYIYARPDAVVQRQVWSFQYHKKK